MIIHECDQYSPEWWEVRRGLPTASAAEKIITPTGKISTQSIGLRNELIAACLGLADETESYSSYWMERGHEMEDEARRYFTFDTGLPVREVGFITNDQKTAGASPDSLVEPFTNRGGEDSAKAGLEIKCPKPSTQIGYLLSGDLPPKYRPQIHWSMAVSGLRRWWFLSYHPELDPVLILVKRDKYTEQMKIGIDQFAKEMLEAKRKLPNHFTQNGEMK